MVLEEKRGVFEAKGMASCGCGKCACHHLTTPCARVGKNEIFKLGMRGGEWLLPHALGLGNFEILICVLDVET